VCGENIAWYDNIPVLSFLVLGGKCRYCKAPISSRYLFIEVVSGVLWVALWLVYGLSPLFAVSVLLTSFLLVMTVTDLETGLIMDSVTYPGMIAGLLTSLVYPALHGAAGMWEGLLRSAVGLLLGAALTYGIGLIGKWVFKKEAMGLGDVKLMAMIGSFLGWQKIILVFFAAPFFALPFALFTKFVKKEETIPYGPFLALAGAVMFFIGNKVWSYLFPAF
jgi:leader peptidase (prepilin peptidase)/N-methyltransferase